MCENKPRKLIDLKVGVVAAKKQQKAARPHTGDHTQRDSAAVCPHDSVEITRQAGHSSASSVKHLQ